MKKLYVLILVLFTAGAAQAQVFNSDFSSWTNNLPDGWLGVKSSINTDSVYQVTSGTVYGQYAVGLKNASSSHKRFTTEPTPVTESTTYEIQFWAKGNGDIRTGLYGGPSSNNSYAYNSYISLASNTWDMYSQTVVAPVTDDSAEFIFSLRYTLGDGIQIDSVSIHVSTPPPVATIQDIQTPIDSSVSNDSPLAGTTVITGGIVTAVTSDTTGYWIQAGVGPYSGVFVYDYSNVPQRGDSLVITAQVSEYNGLTELGSIVDYNVVSSGNPVPAATVLSSNEAGTEPYEGVLVQVMGATCTALPNNYGEWVIDDNSGPANVDDKLYHYTPVLNNTYDVTGVVTYAFNNFFIEPRDNMDINGQAGSGVTSIYNIQYTTNSSGDSPLAGQTVTTSGIVTAIGSHGFFIQDGTGMWSGIYVYDSTDAATINMGDSATVAGMVYENYNETEIKNVTNVEVDPGHTVPAPEILNTNDANQESWEGVLVQVLGNCTVAANNFGEWNLDDGSGAITIDNFFYSYNPMVGTTYRVTGPVTFSFSLFRVSPRDANDIEVVSGLETHNAYPHLSVYPNPTTSNVTVDLGSMPKGKVTYRVFDMLGREVLNGNFIQNRNSLNVSSLAPGRYSVMLNGANGKAAIALSVVR